MDGFEMRDLRKRAKLRQYEIADEFGIHRNTIWGWENNTRKIPKVYEEAFLRLVKDFDIICRIQSDRKRKHDKQRT